MRQRLACAFILISFMICPLGPRAQEFPGKPTTDSGPILEYSDIRGPGGPGFVPAVIDRKAKAPDYPSNEIRNDTEAWVIVSYTIAPDGTVQDAKVTDSVGPQTLRQRALAAVNSMHFVPATLNGVPASQNRSTQVAFFIAYPTPGARPEVVSAYKKAYARLKQGDPQTAIDLLEPMQKEEHLNFYERAMMSDLAGLARLKLGQIDLAQREFSHAVWSDGKYLGKSTMPATYLGLIQTEVQLGHFAEAHEDLEKMTKVVPATNESLQEAKATVANIDAALAKPGAISIPAHISVPEHADEEAVWRHKPSRKTIAFNDLKGKLDRFEIRCDTTTVKGKVETEYEYTLPTSWNKCWLNVYGEPGASFTLVEAP